jgi:hypothetical protein
METKMGLIFIGISYRLLLAAVFFAITKQDWFARPYPILGTWCFGMAMVYHNPSYGIATLTVVGFFTFDLLGIISKYLGVSTKTKNSKKGKA